jgi:hypothetical protein
MSAAAAAVLTLAASLSLGATAAYANTGTITANGAAVQATISTANTPATFTFSGTSGEVVTASTYGGDFASGCDVSLEILAPDGEVVSGAGCVGTSGFIGETPLPAAGTYTVEVIPTGSNPGTSKGSLILSLSADPANSTITVGGPKVTFTASHTGQGQNYTFSGTASEVVTLTSSNGTFPGGCDVTMEIVSPSGSVVASAGCAAQSATISDASLPGTGSYKVEMIPTGSNPGTSTGSVTLALT